MERLLHTSTHCNTLQHATTKCDTQNMRNLREYAEATSVWRDCIILQRTATQYYTLQLTATHCNTQKMMKLNEYETEDVWRNCKAVQHAVQHAATRCNTLQHASTRRNTLQYAATHRIYEG